MRWNFYTPFFLLAFVLLREGRLKPGDRILEINHVDTTKMSLPVAIDLLSESGSHVTLLVEYNVSVIGECILNLLQVEAFLPTSNRCTVVS